MVYWGLYSDSGRENGNYYTVYWGYIGVLEKIENHYNGSRARIS